MGDPGVVMVVCVEAREDLLAGAGVGWMGLGRLFRDGDAESMAGCGEYSHVGIVLGVVVGLDSHNVGDPLMVVVRGRVALGVCMGE